MTAVREPLLRLSELALRATRSRLDGLTEDEYHQRGIAALLGRHALLEGGAQR